MIKLSELEEWLNDLRELIYDISICITNGKRIAIDKYENEKKLKEAGFFYHYQLQQVFIISIQLCKILTDNDKTQRRNVYKLFKALETQEYDIELIERLNSNGKHLARNRDELIIETQKLRVLVDKKTELIQKVKKVRDEAYAHYDPDRIKFGPSLIDYQELLDLAAEVYNALHLQLFGSEMFFKHTIQWEIDPIIRRAAKEFTNVIERRREK